MTLPFRPNPTQPNPSISSGVAVPRLIAEALIFALVTRVALVGIAWWVVRIFGKHDLYPVQLPDRFFPDSLILDGWARWDTAHYVAIAAQGYGGDNPSPHGGLGFFPLFPLLMRGAVEAVRVSPTETHLAFAALVIANLSFAACVALVAALAARIGPEAARSAVVLFCLSPFAFFFNVAYTESVFLLLSLASLALVERRRYWAAAAVAALASGTRLVGLALVPALLWSAWRRQAPRRDLIGVAVLSPLGTIAYSAYTLWKFDDAFAYFNAQATWGGWDEHVRFYAELFLKQPRDALTGDPRHLVIVLNLALGLVALGLLPRVWKVADPGVAAFTILLVVVQFAFTWVSLGRYLLPAAGLYLAAGTILAGANWRGWPRDAVVAVSTLLLATLTALFAHGFWVV